MDAPRTRGLPPKLGIKKRKPRTTAVVEVANGHARKEAAGALVPSAPAQVALAKDGRGRGQQNGPSVAPSAPQAGAGIATSVVDADSVKRKGLRHFAVRVSRKVEEKGITTYNEVADELVVEEKELKRLELEAGGKPAVALRKKLDRTGSLVDEKNIRRRVYDSLNVLMAMSIISKDKKMISWRGLDAVRGGGGPGALQAYRDAVDNKKRTVAEKRRLFLELEDQATTLAALIRRNASVAPARAQGAHPVATGTKSRKRVKIGKGSVVAVPAHRAIVIAPSSAKPPLSGSKPPVAEFKAPNAGGAGPAGAGPTGAVPVLPGASSVEVRPGVSSDHEDKVSLPLVVVSAAEKARIDLHMDHMREDVSFTFSSEFSAIDDREILRRIKQSGRLANI